MSPRENAFCFTLGLLGGLIAVGIVALWPPPDVVSAWLGIVGFAIGSLGGALIVRSTTSGGE